MSPICPKLLQPEVRFQRGLGHEPAAEAEVGGIFQLPGEVLVKV